MDAQQPQPPRKVRAALLRMESALMRMQTRAINLIALIRAMASPAVTLISMQALTKLQKIASLLSTQPTKLAPTLGRHGFPLDGMVLVWAALSMMHSLLPPPRATRTQGRTGRAPRRWQSYPPSPLSRSRSRNAIAAATTVNTCLSYLSFEGWNCDTDT
jgi:hypothetical protein